MPGVYRTRLALPAEAVGPFGEAPASATARLLQEAAIAASTHAGFSPEWYLRQGTIWIVRRSTIESEQPIAAGAEVEVSTWVADFRRVRSRRGYEIRSPPASEPVLRAQTDWVYIDRESARPRRIPEEMMAAFVPERMSPPLARGSLALPPTPAEAFVSRLTVGSADLDELAHVNNARYFDYLEESAVAALTGVGWSPQRMLEAGGILRAGGHDIEYLEEARIGDELRCLTWVAAVDADGFERATEIRHAADACLTRARSLWRWVDRTTGEHRPLPADLRRSLGP